jgi:GntR family transcriptional regulator, transcriptional repressor for pyruvate dehydrogenase complex
MAARDVDRLLAPGMDEVASPGALTLQPLDLRTAPEQISDRLATAIVLGEFVPGQRLHSERELAAQLGVSRATVREALSRLSMGGYLEIRRGRHGGAFVRDGWRPDSVAVIRRTLVANWDGFESLLDFRTLVEPLIARTAAERADESDERAIRDALEGYRAAGPDREASRAADEALHLAVARATHNDRLVAISRRVRAEISLGFSAEPYSATIRERAVHEHGDLADAVLRHDGEAAARIAGQHFRITEDVLRDLIRRVGAEREA